MGRPSRLLVEGLLGMATLAGCRTVPPAEPRPATVDLDGGRAPAADGGAPARTTSSPRVRACRHHVESVAATLDPSEEEATVTALEALVNVYRASGRGDRECAARTGGLLLDTAMGWHMRAIGRDGKRGTEDRKTMARSITLYRMVDLHFTAPEITSFTLSASTPETMTTLAAVRHALADLLWYRGDWQACGPAFDRVIAAEPTGPRVEDAKFAAAQCRDNARRSR